MAALVHRLVAPFLFSLALMLALPATAFGSAPWIAGCSGQPSSSQLCIYRDWHWEGAYGHMSGDNFDYTGETYPSSTYLVDNSISSNKNLYGSLDIRWWWGDVYKAVCTQSNTGIYQFAWFENDQISFHDVVGAC